MPACSVASFLSYLVDSPVALVGSWLKLVVVDLCIYFRCCKALPRLLGDSVKSATSSEISTLFSICFNSLHWIVEMAEG